MSEHDPSAAESELQFDRVAEPRGSGEAESPGVECAECRETIRTEYYQIRDRFVCDRCRRMIERFAEPPTGAQPLIRAGVFGLGAGIAGAAIYYAVLAIAHLEIGIVAILIGYMVGRSVRKGANGRGGVRFQILAVALTYTSIALAYTPMVIQGALSKQQATRASANQPATTARTIEAAQPAPSFARFALAVGMLIGFMFALPVLVVFGSLPLGLISGFIIYLGLNQAWRLTAAPIIDVFGPYRVGTTPTAAVV